MFENVSDVLSTSVCEEVACAWMLSVTERRAEDFDCSEARRELFCLEEERGG